MGGVRQQFTTEAEVRLARESVSSSTSSARRCSSRSATSSSRPPRRVSPSSRQRRAIQTALGVPVERVDPAYVDGLRVDDVLGATICREDGIADPAGVTRELVRRAAALGVDVREHTDALDLDADALVVACGAHSPEVAGARGVELPVRPLVRQLADVGPVDGFRGAADDDRGERLPLPPRRRRRARLAMGEPELRWDGPERGARRPRRGLARRLAGRYPQAAGAPVAAPGRGSTT